MRAPYHRIYAAMRTTLIALLSVIIAPLAVISLLFKYILYGIPLLTPVDWNDEEEMILRRARYHGIPPENLIFVLWRRSDEIRAKMRELNLP